MRRRTAIRRWLGPLLALALVVLATVVALARVGGEAGSEAAAISASGAFEISNSDDGTPIFSATGIGPGGSARGTVEIADTGSVPVELTLGRHELLDAPGLGGGLLSEALALTVTDVTDPAAPLPVYAGSLASMPDRPAGRVEPGASRSYEFVATLPGAGGGNQNALQAASVSVAYSWTASEAEAESPPSETDPDPKIERSTAGPDQQPTGTTPAASPAVEPGAPFRLEVTKAGRRLRGGRLVVWAGCNRSCAISVRGELKATAAGRHRSAKLMLHPGRYLAGGQRLRIPVPARLRRWLAVAPGRRRLRAKLSFTARTPNGGSAKTRRNLALKPPRRLQAPR